MPRINYFEGETYMEIFKALLFLNLLAEAASLADSPAAITYY